MRLFFHAILKYTAGVLITGLLLFLPAGTVRWRAGWMFMCLLFIPMLIAGLMMLVKNPDLLRIRLEAKEKQDAQKAVLRWSGLMFAAGFLLAGLNFRFSWLTLPSWLRRTAGIVFLIAYLLYMEILRENAYLSRTIRVQAGQKVIDTGLYGIVRHPMYAITLPLFLSMPLMLGSPQSFLVFLIYPTIICKRIRHEEQLLKAELPGYPEYCKRVRYRLIPGIW